MNDDPGIHKPKPVRLKGYDYSKEGLYFITICVQNRECILGKIENSEMIKNQIGAIAHEFWLEIPKYYLQVELHEHIIMPNHMHGIIEILPTDIGKCHGVSLQHGVSEHPANDNFPNPFPVRFQ